MEQQLAHKDEQRERDQLRATHAAPEILGKEFCDRHARSENLETNDAYRDERETDPDRSAQEDDQHDDDGQCRKGHSEVSSRFWSTSRSTSSPIKSRISRANNANDNRHMPKVNAVCGQANGVSLGK